MPRLKGYLGIMLIFRLTVQNGGMMGHVVNVRSGEVSKIRAVFVSITIRYSGKANIM